jgi:hypothetical protein
VKITVPLSDYGYLESHSENANSIRGFLKVHHSKSDFSS